MHMIIDRSLLCGLAASLLLAGCGGGSSTSDSGLDAAADGGADTGPADSGPVDSGPTDTGTPDAGSGCTTGCGIVSLALGAQHSCALRENGDVLCWGDNEDLELGDGSERHADCSADGMLPIDCTSRPVLASISDVTELASSGGHSACVRQTDGSVSCWGRAGALRPGVPDPRRATPEAQPTWSGAAQLSDSERHTCAILADGSVSCIWQNDGGQLGDGTSTERLSPVAVSGLTGALELRVSTYPGSFTCARTATDVQCWGINSTGELGDGSTTHQACPSGATTLDCATSPVTVSGLTDATQITAGSEHACALEADGTLVCWGANSGGQLGIDRATAFVGTPTAVPGLTGVQQVVAGSHHTCVLLTGGSVQCFGFNKLGELGDGVLTGHGSICDIASDTGDCSSTPVDVTLPEAATLLAAGERHTCALLESGAVACWGVDDRMQLGQADREPRSTPVLVSGLD